MRRLTAVLLSIVLSFALVVSPNVSFAETELEGPYLTTVVNGSVYQPDDYYYLMTYDGLYYSKTFYKDNFGIDVTENGDVVTFKKDDKVIYEFSKTDLFSEEDDVQVEIYAESTDGEPFYLFEALQDKYQDDFYYNWEMVRDLKTDSLSYKNVSILTSDAYYTDNKDLYNIPVAIKAKSLKDMKNLQSYIKKMTKKPVMTATSVKFTDKACSMELILNSDLDDQTLSDFNIVASGKLSTDAVNLLTAALKDIVPAAESKTVIDQLKRLTNVAAVPKTDQKTYDKIMKRTYNPWYELGDYHKFMYKFDVVEKKTYVDFYITSYYMDTTEYND